MKEQLAALVGAGRSLDHKRLVAREYLQARILEALQRRGAMIALAFQGGTALRFLHSIPRYSEDLDFALEREPGTYDFQGWLHSVAEMLQGEGYAVEVKVSDRRTVHAAFVRFRGLLHELRLSGQPGEVLAVKVEVDTRPPAGAGLETTVVRRHVLLHLQHHDRASLLAGKLHAILARPYAEGRDLYDLLWYLASPDWPAPNLELLNNALELTGWRGPGMTRRTWPDAVAARIQALPWRGVIEDVRPFLEDPAAIDLLTAEGLLGLLERRAARS